MKDARELFTWNDDQKMLAMQLWWTLDNNERAAQTNALLDKQSKHLPIRHRARLRNRLPAPGLTRRSDSCAITAPVDTSSGNPFLIRLVLNALQVYFIHQHHLSQVIPTAKFVAQ
jgi:hypothetical protein